MFISCAKFTEPDRCMKKINCPYASYQMIIRSIGYLNDERNWMTE